MPGAISMCPCPAPGQVQCADGGLGRFVGGQRRRHEEHEQGHQHECEQAGSQPFARRRSHRRASRARHPAACHARQPQGQAAPKRTVIIVVPPSGRIRVWT